MFLDFPASPERDIFRILHFSCCRHSGFTGAQHFKDLAFFLLWTFWLRRCATFSASCSFPAVDIPASPERDIVRILPFSCCRHSDFAGAQHFQDRTLFLLSTFRLRLSAIFSGSCLFPSKPRYRTSPIPNRPTECNLADITCYYLLLPSITHCYPLLTDITIYYLLLPAITRHYYNPPGK